MNVLIPLKELMGDDFSLLVNSYIESSNLAISKISESIKTQNLEIIKLNSHSLKSSSAQLGIVEFSKIAADIEQMYDGDKDNEAISKCNDLINMYPVVVEALKEAINNI